MEANQINPALENLANQLKAARANSGLSQRALSARIDVPQSHISKIESGQVDIKTSSLIELARALGLELMLVPRNLVPAIESLSRSGHAVTKANDPVSDQTPPTNTVKDTQLALEKFAKDAARFSKILGNQPELARLSKAVQDIQPLLPSLAQTEQIAAVLKSITAPSEAFQEVFKTHKNIKALIGSPELAESLRKVAVSADTLRNLRNALAHGAVAPPRRSVPAYRLSDGDDDA